MKYTKLDDRLIIEDLSEFNIKQILDCGQIFRYWIDNDEARVISTNKFARIKTHDTYAEIITKEVDYFEHFFDLKNDYGKIKDKLSSDKFLRPCIEFGYGIRILHQDLFEMIVSFIVSANNNIKRIKNSLNKLSEQFGTNMGDYFAFPTLTQLKSATIQDFADAGLGYRAEQMHSTIQRLTDQDLSAFYSLDLDEQTKFLLSLKGVGKKVADCILLFAMGHTNSFPVDTWINKIYNKIYNTTITDRKQISENLTQKYGNLSGYAQQYFFYYYRENNIN